jgi:DNA-binding transcriptional ArsR family regulator
VSPDNLNRTFAALADPTRRAIIAQLADGEATVTELAAPFDLAQPSISKHLKVLERAGLISRGRAAQTRPCRLEAVRLKEIANWVEMYRKLWDDSFDRLDTFLKSTKSTPSRGKKNGGKS